VKFSESEKEMQSAVQLFYILITSGLYASLNTGQSFRNVPGRLVLHQIFQKIFCRV
jgi:hypothetical protein